MQLLCVSAAYTDSAYISVKFPLQNNYSITLPYISTACLHLLNMLLFSCFNSACRYECDFPACTEPILSIWKSHSLQRNYVTSSIIIIIHLLLNSIFFYLCVCVLHKWIHVQHPDFQMFRSTQECSCTISVTAQWLKGGKSWAAASVWEMGLCQLTRCLGLGNGVVSIGMLPRSEQWGCVN